MSQRHGDVNDADRARNPHHVARAPFLRPADPDEVHFRGSSTRQPVYTTQIRAVIAATHSTAT
jgi:hypothetical protein